MSFMIDCPVCKENIYADTISSHCLTKHRENAVEVYDKCNKIVKEKVDKMNVAYYYSELRKMNEELKEIKEEYKSTIKYFKLQTKIDYIIQENEKSLKESK